MVEKVFCVYDSKAEAYMRPFLDQSTGAAMRSFSDEVNSDSKESMLATHPEDFTAFELGSWDDEKSVFDLHITPISLGLAIEFAALSNEDKR